MANYVKSTDFQAKDALLTGNPAKIIKGTEINDEFNAIQTAVATKADLASPAFIGNPTAATQAPGNSSTRLATTAFVDGELTSAFATLGTISTQDANNVAITGGTISGLTSLAIPVNTVTNTPLVGDDSTKIATTAFVNAEIANDIGNAFLGSNQSLSESGFQKFPGGLILQWGRLASLPVNSATTVTLPTSFATSAFVGFIAINEGNGTDRYSAKVVSVTTTTITLWNSDSDALPVYWLAIGK